MKNVGARTRPYRMPLRYLVGAVLLAALTGCRSSDLEIDGFHAAKGGTDRTSFALGEDGGDVTFRFDVADPTPFSAFRGAERDLESGDRVEVFFSPSAGLDGDYLCLEIDPCGNVLDYRARFPRRFDYAWRAPKLTVKASCRADGYTVEGKIAKDALRAHGIDPDACWIGVFRADFDRDGLVEWYSAVPFCEGPADFHQPKMFFRRAR